ncbi:hypothetical protein L7F22_068802 [Adiantum nelumboides]|nr:hypothetical protein [Adiantum nelumboides]
MASPMPAVLRLPPLPSSMTSTQIEDLKSITGADNGSAEDLQLSAEEYAQAALERLFASPLFSSNDNRGALSEEEQTKSDLHVTAGDLTFGDDAKSDDISLEGLQEELEKFQSQQVIASILGKGSELREYARDVEEKLRQVELESIQPDEQPVVEQNESIFVPEQVLAHEVTKKGKARRRFLIKFKNFPAFDAKWMEEEDLADTPQIVKLYLEAFGLA